LPRPAVPAAKRAPADDTALAAARPPICAQVVRAAVEEGLVTPHTAAVGVMVQADPLDPSAVKRVEVPLQVPHGRTLWQQESSGQDLAMPAPQVHAAVLRRPAAPSRLLPARSYGHAAALGPCRSLALRAATDPRLPSSSPCRCTWPLRW
jgi:hypothetical protein